MTREEELAGLLDVLFEGSERPDFAAIRELAFNCRHWSWVITELMKVLWLYGEDPAAFDEYVWSLNNGDS